MSSTEKNAHFDQVLDRVEELFNAGKKQEAIDYLHEEHKKDELGLVGCARFVKLCQGPIGDYIMLEWESPNERAKK